MFWSEHGDRFFNPDVVGWLARNWRLNVLRVPIGAQFAHVADEAKRIRPMLASLVEAATAVGVYILVDWHAHEMFLNEAAEFFGSVAAEFSACPNVIYETWNEPRRGFDWVRDIRPYHQRMAECIRRSSPNAVIVAGTEDFSRRVDLAADLPLDHANIVYALHFYAATHRQGLRSLASQAISKGLPLFVSEWGMSEANGGGSLDRKEADRWLNFLDAAKIGHINWSIFDKNEASCALKARSNPRGGWRWWNLTPSGRYVRNRLRRQRCVPS